MLQKHLSNREKWGEELAIQIDGDQVIYANDKRRSRKHGINIERVIWEMESRNEYEENRISMFRDRNHGLEIGHNYM